MNLPLMPYGDWITAIFTLGYVQALAAKRTWAWPLAMFTQFLWFYLSLSKELYGLAIMAAIMFVQFGYGWWRSYRPH
jgi:nicotinamide riboside transporter PnuC